MTAYETFLSLKQSASNSLNTLRNKPIYPTLRPDFNEYFQGSPVVTSSSVATSPSVATTPCCYRVNPVTKQFYQLANTANVRTDNIANYDPNLTNELTFLGPLDHESSEAKIVIYVNGLPAVTEKLSKVPNIDKGKLVIGQANGSNISVEKAKYFNYVLGDLQMLTLAEKQLDGITKTLITTWAPTSGTVNIAPNLLPKVNTSFTFAFWMNTSVTNQTIFTGPVNTAIDQNGIVTSFSIQQQQQQQSGLADGTWHHVAVSFHVNNGILYVDGQNVASQNATMPSWFGTKTLTLSNFSGQISNCIMANFHMNQDQINALIAQRPDYKSQSLLRSMWKSAGCITDLSLVPSKDKYITMIERGQTVSVQKEISNLAQTQICKGVTPLKCWNCDITKLQNQSTSQQQSTGQQNMPSTLDTLWLQQGQQMSQQGQQMSQQMSQQGQQGQQWRNQLYTY